MRLAKVLGVCVLGRRKGRNDGYISVKQFAVTVCFNCGFFSGPSEMAKLVILKRSGSASCNSA